jgi:hypothetical protein
MRRAIRFPCFAATSHGSHVPDRFSGRDCLYGVADCLRVDTEVSVEIGNGSGLAEMLDAERAGAVAVDGSKPCERRRVSIDHAHESAMRGYVGEQTLDVASRMDKAVLARPLRRRPAGIQPVG